MSAPLKANGRRVNAATKIFKTTTTTTTTATTTKTAKGKAAENTNKWNEDDLRRSLGLDARDSALEPRKVLQLANAHLAEASNALSSMLDSKKTATEVATIAKSCRVALEAARKWSDKKVEIERRASSLCSKLIALDALQSARELLNEMRPCLLELYRHDAVSDSPLTLPLPLEAELNPELLNLLVSTLVHQLYVSVQHPDFISSLYIPGSFYSWLQFPPPDSTIRRGYSALSKHPAFVSKIASLKCILKSAEVETDAFWGQTVQFGAAHAKAAGQDANKQLEAARQVSKAYDEIVSLASERSHFLEGESFVKFCKHWTSFARRLQDHSTLEKVSKYLEASPAHDCALESAQLCARLLKLNAALTSPPPTFQTDVDECISVLKQPNYKKVLNDPQVVSEAERLRRGAGKLLDPATGEGIDSSTRESVVSLILALVRPDKVNFYLDSIITLARTSLSSRDSATWNTSFDHLQKGYDLLYAKGKPIALAKPTIESALYLHALGNSYSNCGGTLYNEERYGAATRFFVRATQVIADAMAVYAASTEEKTAESKAQWIATEKRMPRIWEVLGRCYVKMGERRSAYDAYCSSLRETLLCDGQTVPLAESTVLLIERVTSLAVMDLFLQPEEVSLRTTLLGEPALEGKVSSEVVAAVLESQVNFLRHHVKKQNVDTLTQSLIMECMELYGEKMPVRRARAQLQLLEFAFLSKSDIIDTRKVVRQVDEMAHSKALHDDAHLASLQKLYAAAASGWMALITHSRRDSVALPDREILEHITRAATIMHEYKLEVLTPPTPPAPPAQATKGKSKALAKSQAVKRGAKSATSAAGGSKTVARRGKVAPPVEDATSSAAANSTGSCLRQSAAAKEGREYAFHILDVITQFSGLMGHLVQRIQILDALREIAKVFPGHLTVHVTASLQLSRELFHLGMISVSKSVHDELSGILKQEDNGIPVEIRTQALLGYAELLSTTDPVEGKNLYTQAFDLAEKLCDDTNSGRSTGEILAAKIASLERTAAAVNVYASILDGQDQVHEAFQLQHQSMRLWSKAADYLSRYGVVESPVKPARAASPNPFNVTGLKEAVQEIAAESKAAPQLPEAWRTFHHARTLHGAEWKVAFGLVCSLHAMIETYMRRGSAKAALRLSEDAEVLVASLGSRALRARIMIQKGELLVYTGDMEAGYKALAEARELLSTVTGSDAADVYRMLGVYHILNCEMGDADDMFDEGITHLQSLERMVSDASRVASQETKEVFAANLVAELLRESVWLCRGEQNSEDFMGALELLVDSSQSALSQGLLHLLTGKLAMHGAHDYFSGSLCLSSLTESTISLPLGMTGTTFRTTPSTAKVNELLSEAEGSFEKSMLVLHRRGTVAAAREAAICYFLSRAFQTSLGSAIKSDSVVLSNLLDASCSITLSREMLEAVDGKVSDPRSQRDVRWPLAVAAIERLNAPDSDEDFESEKIAGFKYREYWETIRKRRISSELTIDTLSQPQSQILPPNWTVISISTTEDQNALLVSRQRSSGEPLTFCIPLSRHGRKEEDDEDQQLTYSDAIKELEEIISSSNAQAKEAIHVQGKEAKASWWSGRRELNGRLKDLVENIEFCWLGGFKGVFTDMAVPDSDFLAALRARLESAFARVLRLNLKGKGLPPLDDVLLECFASLPPKCRDEELEDILYFMLDLYQLHSVPVALAEVDMDEVVVEVRAVLEDTSAKLLAGGQSVVKDAHMFLVLDKNVQGIPWESLPILRGKTISRIPSLSFLIDRLEMSNFYDRAPDPRGFRINPSRTFYVMNPSGDLKATEDTFRDWAKEMEPHGWKGLIGRAPMETELVSALEHQDLFIYFGHGNGEQFIRGRKIRTLRRCAATMIWGCSSGLMKDMGSFDRTGTPAHYMLAGCPTLIANLWDVTDRDMDKFTNSVFSKIGLTKDRVAEWHRTSSRWGGEDFANAPSTADSVSIVEAVAKSRDVCKMDFLVGAAPVVYGVPFYI